MNKQFEEKDHKKENGEMHENDRKDFNSSDKKDSKACLGLDDDFFSKYLDTPLIDQNHKEEDNK
jgi:hypothetical protein